MFVAKTGETVSPEDIIGLMVKMEKQHSAAYKAQTKDLTISKQENTMHTMQTTTTAAIEANQRSFMEREMRIAYSKHENELERKFHIIESTPKTTEEAVQRIKDGKYQVIAGNNRCCYYSDWHHNIQWRLPDEVKDVDGYKAAKVKLDAAYKRVLQDIIIDPIEKAKDSLRTFENWTLH